MQMNNGGTIGRTAMILGALMLIFSSADIDAAQWGGYTENIGGIPSMMNPEAPMLPVEIIKTEELWRVGADDDEEAAMVGFVTDVLVDEQGNSYLLDSTLNVIRVFGPQGNALREIGREGEGPGEFGIATQFMFLPNKEIGVIQMMPAKVITMDCLGVPGAHFALAGDNGGMNMIQNADSYAGGVVVGMVTPQFSESSASISHSLSVVDSKGEVLHTIIEHKEKVSGGSFSIGGGGNEFTQHWSVSTDGIVYVAQHSHEYKIEVFNADGQAERLIQREYKSLKRSSQDLAEEEERNASLAARFGGTMEMEIDKYERDINTMHPREKGVLWVETSRGTKDCPEGQLGLFDEFSSDGKFMRQVGIAVDYDAQRDSYVLVKDRLYILKEAQKQPATTSTGGGEGSRMIVMTGNVGDDDDDDEEEGMPPGVVCYQLVR